MVLDHPRCWFVDVSFLPATYPKLISVLFLTLDRYSCVNVSTILEIRERSLDRLS